MPQHRHFYRFSLSGAVAWAVLALTTTPLQALNLLNSHFVIQQAGLFADRLRDDAGSADQQVERAWNLCFNRKPGADEIAESLRFIEAEGLEAFARAMLNANELVFIP